MSEDATAKRLSSRRAMLGGAALRTAVLVADAIRPAPAQATTGSPVIDGRANFATNPTTLANNGTQGNTTGDAVFATGASFGGIGLTATSNGGGSPAIQANGDGNGVTGQTANPVASGVYGENDGGGFGVAGRSNQGGGTCVLGEALGAAVQV